MKSKSKTINKTYSKEIIALIIDEYKVMKHQFLIITDDQIIESISELLDERLNFNKN